MLKYFSGVLDKFLDIFTRFRKLSLRDKIFIIAALSTIAGISLANIPGFFSSDSEKSDPLAKLNKLGFHFDTASYFQAVKTGRPDVVSLFFDAGMSPYTSRRDDELRRDGTAISFAIAWKIPNICAKIDMFSKRGMDITSRQAPGSYLNKTLMDDAVENHNVEAATCLKKYFPHLQSYRDFLVHRHDIIEKLMNSPDNSPVGHVLQDCRKAVLYMFGRPECYEGISSELRGRVDEMVDTTCLFRGVYSFEKELNTDFAYMLKSDQEMLKVLGDRSEAGSG